MLRVLATFSTGTDRTIRFADERQPRNNPEVTN
jgi:hypothetical protein